MCQTTHSTISISTRTHEILSPSLESLNENIVQNRMEQGTEKQGNCKPLDEEGRRVMESMSTIPNC